MAQIKDYKITERELQKYGLFVKDYLKDNAVASVIEVAFQTLLTRIFELNHDVEEENDINIALDTYEKIEAFKYAQFLIIWALLNTDETPITSEVDSVIANRLRLKKVNGWQK